VFGGSGTTLEFELGGHPYSLPFPPTWKKSKPFELKPGKANVLGIIEVRLTEKPDAKKPLVAQIRLDSSTAAKRQIVQTTLQALNDVSRPNDFSEGEVSWTAELQAALVGLSAAPASSLP
jgi:hypothetical protein